MTKPLIAVLTTIQEPTRSVSGLLDTLRGCAAPLLVVGDRKGPASFVAEGSRFVSIEEQRRLDFALVPLLPEAHYTRKNLGYLLAISEGAECIYETDDDNAPLQNWSPRALATGAARLDGPRDWTNVYAAFSNEHIWPRGFPLDAVKHGGVVPARNPQGATVIAPIQQGLANGAPDVDAVWRLVLDHDITFDAAPSVVLSPGMWCPFNSQSTWWWPEAYPLLYLPSRCSFRMTDIWRSFVAQRCLWALGHGVVFHTAEVVQDRNDHSLIRDFEQEIPGYLRNREIAIVLDGLDLAPGSDKVAANLVRCYEALVDRGIFPPDELSLLRAWVADLETVTSVASSLAAVSV